MPVDKITDDQLRKTVGESLNIFQSTITIASILLGFVFAALLQLLSSPEELTSGQSVTASMLVASMLALLTAVICFHITAHQVIHYWKIFFPNSTARRIGAVLFPLGLAFMLAAVATMLSAKDENWLALFVLVAALALMLSIIKILRGMHHQSPHSRDVGKRRVGG